MTFPQLVRFVPLCLLLLRFIVGIIFADSGWRDLRNPQERAKGLGMGKPFTIFLGSAEIAGGLGIIFGVLPQLAALGLILIMLGAMYKKIFVWHIPFWGEKTYGWHYDLMLLIMNLLIVVTGGGPYVLTK